MKKKFIIIITALIIVFCQLIVNAADFTSTNPDKNSTYNRNSAIWYAGTYVTTINSAYGECKNQLGGSEDCTNFASQILKCASMSELVDGTRNTNAAADSMKSWYFTSLSYPKRSTSWTGAPQFRQHWGNVNNTGYERAYAMKSWLVNDLKTNLSDLYNYVNPGDILQYSDSAGVTQHTQIVYAKYSGGDIYVAQHSANGYWFLSDYLAQTQRVYLSAIRIKRL